MRCCECDQWKDVDNNGYGTCTCKEAAEYGVCTISFHTCENTPEDRLSGTNPEMGKLKVKITKEIIKLNKQTKNRHMNDREESRLCALQEVLEMIDEITETL